MGCGVFKRGGYKIRQIFCIIIKILKGNYYWILSFWLTASCQRVTKFEFQSQFSIVKNHPNLSNFFSLKNTNLGAHFCYWHFLIKSILKSLQLLKWCPIFDSSPLIQNSKFNNFFWVCWFLCKIFSNFVLPAWKLHNPHCHSPCPPHLQNFKVKSNRYRFLIFSHRIYDSHGSLRKWARPTWMSEGLKIWRGV